jgi:hypothetical protein
MKSVITLRGVYNIIKANLDQKARKLDSLVRRTDNTSVVIPEATTQIVKKKMYSEVLSGNKQDNAGQKTFKLTVRSKISHSIGHIKYLVKTKFNPVDMKIGITTFKGLRNGRLLIETQNKTEIYALSKTINEVCGEELEASTP